MSTAATSKQNSSSQRPQTVTAGANAKPQKIPRHCLPSIPIRLGAFLCIFAMLTQLGGSLTARLVLAPNKSGFPFDLLFGGGALLAFLGVAWAAWTRNAKWYQTLDWTGSLMYIVAVVVLINPSVRLALASSNPDDKSVDEAPVFASLFGVNLVILYMCTKYAVVLNHEAKVKEGSAEERV